MEIKKLTIPERTQLREVDPLRSTAYHTAKVAFEARFNNRMKGANFYIFRKNNQVLYHEVIIPLVEDTLMSVFGERVHVKNVNHDARQNFIHQEAKKILPNHPSSSDSFLLLKEILDSYDNLFSKTQCNGSIKIEI